MRNFVKSILIAGAAVAMTTSAVVPASANDWHHGNDNWHYHGGWHHAYGGYDGWGYGAAGLATGLIVGSAIAQPGYYGSGYYGDYGYAPPPRYYYHTHYIHDVGLRPWSPAWTQYCFSRYRTFDDHTGTFVGNDGVRHFCVAS